MPTLVLRTSVLPRQPKFSPRQATLKVFGGDNDREVPAKNLGLCVADDALGLLIPGGGVAFQLHHEDGLFLDVLQERGISGFKLPSRFFRQTAFGPVPDGE